MGFRNDIQGLRAIAVLSVLIFHLNPSWLPGGFLGVDVFFVISGFLISSICFGKIEKGNFTFLDFYKSRIKRIVPTYYIMLLITGIACLLIYIPYDLFSSKWSYLSSLTFLSNIYFPRLDIYFGATSSENPFLHTWTLAVEMQFYLYLPLLLVFIKNKKWLFFTIVFLTLSLFAYGTISILSHNNSAIYFSLLARTPEFMIGVLASMIYTEWNRIKLLQKYTLFIYLLSLIVLFVCFFKINKNSEIPGFLTAIPCMATAFLLLSRKNIISSFLSNKFFLFIGNISYSLYLWHWPIMALTRYYYSVSEFSRTQTYFISFLSLFMAIASYYLIENRIKKINTKLFWYSIIILFSLNIFGVYKFYIQKGRTPYSIPNFYWKPSFGLKSHSRAFEHVETMGDTLSKCPRILLIGDSHAYTMKYYFHLLGEKYHFNFTTLSNAKYPPIVGLERTDFDIESNYSFYNYLSDNFSEKEIIKSDIVILTMTKNYSWKTKIIKSLIKKLKPTQSLVFITDYPTLNMNPLKKNKDFIKNHQISQDYITNDPSLEVSEEIKEHPNFYYLNLSKEKTFSNAPYYHDTLMYYDQGHLNMFGQKVYFENTHEEAWALLDSIFNKYSRD